MVIRCPDITVFNGQTSENEPATLKDWRQVSINEIIGVIQEGPRMSFDLHV
jgi:hypothetical protein